MTTRWRTALQKGLGGPRTRATGLLLIVVGAFTKLLLLRYAANIETIFAVCLIAGSVLGRWWTVLVPLGTLAIVEPILWGGPYAFYTMNVVLGLSFFMVTGFVFVGLVGRTVKPHVVLRVGSLALLSAISIPMTVAYDLWTDIGEYYFIAGPMGLTFWQVLQLQFIFTVYHVISSLIFVPLVGMGIFYLHAVLWPSSEETATGTPASRPTPADHR